MSDHPIFTESIRRIRELLAQRATADQALAVQLARLSDLERDVLERCIHSSGDVSIAADLVFAPAVADGPVNLGLQDPWVELAAGSPSLAPSRSAAAGRGAAGPGPGSPDLAAAPRPAGTAPHSACARALAALRAGAPILTDTAMAAAAVTPMVRRTFGNRVACVLDWAPEPAPPGSTRAALGMERAWAELAAAVGEVAAPLVLIGSAPTALEVLLDLVAAGAPAPSLIIGMPVGFVGVAESKRHLAAAGLDHIRLEGSRGGAGLVAAACNALLRAGWRLAEQPPHRS